MPIVLNHNIPVNNYENSNISNFIRWGTVNRYADTGVANKTPYLGIKIKIISNIYVSTSTSTSNNI